MSGGFDVIYLQESAVQCIASVLPTRSEPFVLVTGDETVPDETLSEMEFRTFISDPRLVHWFSQNLASQDDHRSQHGDERRAVLGFAAEH